MYPITIQNTNNSQPVQKECSMKDKNTIKKSDILNKIDYLQNYYNIDMGKELIKSNALPSFFSAYQINENTVCYEFETEYGSGEFIIKNFNKKNETVDYNDIVAKHIKHNF